ncbi:LptA/OstA family protein [Tropicimonas isoalkanivorans]|uniref:Lipopolysaccharide export system protein LptA n=1 Tax=Tropicimonas isoalkanivorans TaxID=441112 RepID=A0A1I1M0Q1_9RHOB|nr:LptA/OstA family protein [Tropicimonas isoalkanivorans]SFC78949.1 lipopolysaccharide export system protein LptA [Tropicimonas isoalkanivorans]
MFLRSLPFATAFLLLAGPLFAQGASIGFGNSDHDSSLPVEITADQLDVNQTDGRAKFTGNVVVGQGEMRLTGEVVDVEYGDAGTGTTEIKRLHATGGVTLVNGSEAAEGQEAVYTIESGEVVMTGDVLLTQGDNAMAGEKLTVNLQTGTGVMEGRVRVVFQPQEQQGAAQ